MSSLRPTVWYLLYVSVKNRFVCFVHTNCVDLLSADLLLHLFFFFLLLSFWWNWAMSLEQHWFSVFTHTDLYRYLQLHLQPVFTSITSDTAARSVAPSYDAVAAPMSFQEAPVLWAREVWVRSWLRWLDGPNSPMCDQALPPNSTQHVLASFRVRRDSRIGPHRKWDTGTASRIWTVIQNKTTCADSQYRVSLTHGRSTKIKEKWLNKQILSKSIKSGAPRLKRSQWSMKLRGGLKGWNQGVNLVLFQHNITYY